MAKLASFTDGECFKPCYKWITSNTQNNKDFVVKLAYEF